MVLIFLIVLCIYGLEFLVYRVLEYFEMNEFEFRAIFFLLLIASSVLLLMAMPLQIYKQLVEDRKIDILLVAPLKVNVCFGYEFLVSWFKVILIYFFATFLPIYAVYKLYNIDYVYNIIFGFFHFTSEIMLLYLLFFIMYFIFKTKQIKKAIMILGGIIDVAFTLAVMSIINYIDFVSIIKYIDTVPILKYYYQILELSRMKIQNILIFGIWGLFLLVLYFCIYCLFRNIYEKTGFYEEKRTVKHKQFHLRKKIPSNCLLWKDIILMARDFKIIKDVFLYFLLWSISAYFTITDMDNFSLHFWLVLSLTMNFFITFQICSYFVKLDKSKIDIFSLAGISLRKIWRQKVLFVFSLSGGVTIIYNILICFVWGTTIKYVCIINLCTLIGCIWCSMFAVCAMVVFYYGINTLRYKSEILCLESILYLINYVAVFVAAMLIINDTIEIPIILKIGCLFGIVVVVTFVLKKATILTLSKISFF